MKYKAITLIEGEVKETILVPANQVVVIERVKKIAVRLKKEVLESDTTVCNTVEDLCDTELWSKFSELN